MSSDLLNLFFFKSIGMLVSVLIRIWNFTRLITASFSDVGELLRVLEAKNIKEEANRCCFESSSLYAECAWLMRFNLSALLDAVGA